MFGKNKILKAESHDGSRLDIVEIFPTLQGEGPYVGWPSVFVRLGGCNLACEFCDTEFEDYKNLAVEDIVKEVTDLSKNSKGDVVRKLIVITGGEPLRQPIEKLCQEFVKLNFLVQIETNGTLFRELPKEVKIICSPKISNGKYHKIRPDLLSRIDAFKFIVRAPYFHPEHNEGSQDNNKENYSVITDVGQSECNIPVYVQPMDEYDEVRNKNNLEYVVKVCGDNGYLLSIQLHKILGVR